MNLNLHKTFWKNWDLGLFIGFILKNCKLHAYILDVGCANNPLLHNLRRLGYVNLFGIDLKIENLTYPGVHYIRGDLTNAPFPDGQFDCVTSLSVMEHCSDPGHYFKEMARLLRIGGFLLTSTDYWPEKIETTWVPKFFTFGLPWTIYSKSEVKAFLQTAKIYGLFPTSPIDLSAERPLIFWPNRPWSFLWGKRYTFLAFVLQRRL
ncbi:MAG: class I SAM-dependent methyltransferase [Pyrobaculum sp.]